MFKHYTMNQIILPLNLEIVCVKLFSVDLSHQYLWHSIFVRFFTTALRLLTVPYGLRSTNQEPNP